MSKPGVRKRFFAWALKKTDAINYRIYSRFKRELFHELKGTMVEVGPGTGINLSFLTNVDSWIGIEPNSALHSRLNEAASRCGINATILSSSAENIPLPENFADAVICTLVLCSVSDPEKVVAEMKRILKPGGKLTYIEHVAATPHSALRLAQNIFNPLNRFVADGCNCNRETWVVIEKAGFNAVSITHHHVKEMIKLHQPHVMGFAIK